MLKRHAQLMLTLLGFSDMLAALAAWGAAYYLRLMGSHLGWSRYPTPSMEEFLPYVLLSLILCPLIYIRMDLYGPKRTIPILRELGEAGKAVVIIWVLTYLAGSLFRQTPLSRMMMLLLLVSWLVLAMVARACGRITLQYARAKGSNIRTAAIIGTGRLAQKLHNTIKNNPWTGIVVSYFIDDARCDEVNHVKVAGPIDNLEAIFDNYPVDVVFLAMSKPTHVRTEDILYRLSKYNVEVQLVPNLLSMQTLRHKVMQLDELSIISLTYSPQHGWNSLIKRVFDVVFAVAALVVMSVPMILFAIILKVGGGKVLYVQTRTSVGGRPFRMLKFRTMKASDEAEADPLWTVPDDPRITRFGRFLRRTSLDELPQLINVLLGDMSMVGPRPERPVLIEQFKKRIPRYMLRHQVKAGITGWAQVHGLRGNTSLRKRIQYDLFYIRNWTFGLDLWILLMTPFRGMINRNAY